METYSKKDIDEKMERLRLVLQNDFARTRKMLNEMEVITRSLERCLPYASFEFIERFNSEMEKIKTERRFAHSTAGMA
jgi:hypothetical protein